MRWSSWRHCALLLLVLATRVGEADNPGPRDPALVFLGACNPTGLNGKHELVATLPQPALWAVSESHLTSPGADKFRQGLKLSGSSCSFLGGYPAPIRQRSKVVGAHTGVGFVSSFPIRAASQQWPEAVWRSSRIQAAHVFLHAVWLLAAVVYGYPVHPQSTVALLEEATQRVVLEGDGPRLLAGDFNLEVGHNPLVDVWRSHGFVELQELHERLGGCAPRPTCKGVTRKDFLYLSPEVQGWFLQAYVEVGPFADHSLLFGRFRVPGLPEPRTVWRVPVHRPRRALSRLQLPQGAFALQVQSQGVVTGAAGAVGTDSCVVSPSEGYRRLCAEFEERLSCALVQDEQAPLTAAEKGRACTSDLTAVRGCQAPVKRARQGDVQPTFHGTSLKHVHWVRQARRLQALAQNLQKGSSLPGAVAQRVTLWRAVLLAPGFGGSFVAWWPSRQVHLSGDPCRVPECLPGFPVADAISCSFLANLRAYEKAAATARCKEAVERRRLNPALIFRDLKEEVAAPVQTLVECRAAKVVEVRSDEAAVLLDRSVAWRNSPISAGGGPLEVHHAEADMVWGEVEHLCPGDELRQTCLVASLPALFHAFGSEWQKRWGRHDNVDPARWQEATAGLRHLVRGQPMELPPITEEEWRSSIRRKAAHTSTGLDGLSRMDFALMPSDLLQVVLGLCLHAERTGDWPRQALEGVVAALAKRPQAEGVGDYRPITVLSLLYRTWGSIRARQALRHLESLVPATLYGHMSGRTAGQLWFSLQLQLESSRYDGVPLTGAIADLEKAFNLIPRVPVMAAARVLGLAEPLLKAWHGALCTMRRRFKIRGSHGPGILSSTGYPEGCALSCVSMAIVDIAMHCQLRYVSPHATVSSYVDNWEICAPSVPTMLDSHQAMVRFAHAWDLFLDPHKTQAWSTGARDRHSCRAAGFQVCLDTRDLGGHVLFSGRRTNFTVTQRIGRLQGLWPRLRASFAATKHKVASLAVSAWPRGLHGVAGVTLGRQQFCRLRAGALQGLSWDRPGASPLALLSLLGFPLTDPQFFAVRQTVLDFRALTVKEIVSPLIEEILPVRSRFPGPVGVLLERVASLQWTWNEASQQFEDWFGGLCIWSASPQELDFRLAFSWQRAVAYQVEGRRDFRGLGNADFLLTRQLSSAWQGASAELLRVSMGGAFYTQDKLRHVEENGSGLCRFCGQQDSIHHRVWQCAEFQVVRSQSLPPGFPAVLDLPECQRLHAWAMQPRRQVELWRALASLPDTSWNFVGLPNMAQLDLFVDGSCIFPASPHLRLASWAVVLARHDASVPPSVLNAGLLPGLVQSSFRAEIFAVLVACRLASLTEARVRVWCDCLGVVRRCHGLMSRSWTVKPSTKNSDLWHLVVEAIQAVRGSFEVCKVDSHLQEREDDDYLTEWLILNNSDVDAAARSAGTQRGEFFWTMWRAVQQDLAFQSYIGQAVMRVHVEVGQAATRRRCSPVEGPLGDDASLPLPLLCLGQASVRRDTQFAHKYGNPFLTRFEDWFRTTFFPTDASADRLRWVAVFQLVVAYVQEFGRRPPFYDRTSQTWYEADDRQRGELIVVDAGQLTSWFCRLLRAYVLATGGSYHSADARPDSTVLQVKMRVVKVYWPLDVASQVESFLACKIPGAVCRGQSRAWASLRF